MKHNFVSNDKLNQPTQLFTDVHCSQMYTFSRGVIHLARTILSLLVITNEQALQVEDDDDPSNVTFVKIQLFTIT